MTGNTNIGAHDKTGQGVAFCQTVLPGNEVCSAYLLTLKSEANASRQCLFQPK